MPPLTLRPNEEAKVLEEKLNRDEAAENARELTLNNCVFADPDDLLRCVIRCAKLEALLCVSSGIVLAHVIDQILPKLDHLRNLEFTLDKREERHDLEWIRQKIRISNAFGLKRLYVEVTGFARTQALAEMVAKLPSLTELHVHMLHGSLSDLLFMMEGIWSANLAIQCFKITSEVPPREQAEPRVATSSDATSFSDYANVCGNLLLRRAPPTRNCFRLRDLAVRTEPLHPTEPVIVVINNDEVTQAQMHEAGKRSRWQDVHCLTLVLVGTGTLSLDEIARADAIFHSGLLTFFENFKNERTGLRSLRELNMSSFHFKDELDFTEVLSGAGLTALTALSVTPCGIWHQGALGRLANTCTQLDDLDVRIYTNYRRCLRCWQPLVLCQEPASPLRLEPRPHLILQRVGAHFAGLLESLPSVRASLVRYVC
ncbi:hypothetical protein HPB50_025464 [Hyalomma asiaticum]|uniref:Uncharacterized protein n=1 Tax=Hyalomma asiaticum TaxID=266040 RepID=A0ACB7SAD2_HYAAI|nr:hypothetical protein HPB50_025464 [Hyalomma asiaticum]